MIEKDRSLSPAQAEVLDAVQRCIGDADVGERTHVGTDLLVDDLVISVTPQAANALPVRLTVPSRAAATLELELGVEGAVFEIWQRGNDRLSLVRRCMAAVLHGRYREEVSRYWLLAGMVKRFNGVFETPSGSLTFGRVGHFGSRPIGVRVFGPY